MAVRAIRIFHTGTNTNTLGLTFATVVLTIDYRIDTWVRTIFWYLDFQYIVAAGRLGITAYFCTIRFLELDTWVFTKCSVLRNVFELDFVYLTVRRH